MPNQSDKIQKRIKVFTISFFGYSMLHAMRASWSYSKNLILDQNNHINIDKSQLGYVDMLFLLCYSFGLTIIGPYGDRINRKYFLSIGYFICSFAYMIFPISYEITGIANFHILLIFMAINGLFESVGMPGSMGILYNWFSKKNRGTIIGFWAGCCNFGNIFGLISSTIITQYLHARWVYNFFFNGIMAMIMSIVIYKHLEPQPQNRDSFLTQFSQKSTIERKKSRISDSGIQQIIASRQPINYLTSFNIPRVKQYVIGYTCLKASIYGLLFWLPRYIKAQGMIESTGFIPSMTEVGTFIGGIFIGHMGDRYPRSLFLAPMMYFSTIMMLIVKIFLSDNPLPYYLIIFLMGFGLGGPYNIIGTVISIDLGTHKCLRGDQQAISTITGVIDGTGALFSALTQLILGMLPINLIFYLFAFYTLVGAIALTGIFRQDLENLMESKNKQNNFLQTQNQNIELKLLSTKI